MKILLTTLNSKYLHSSLALRYLKTYAKLYEKSVNIKEFTINNQEDFIISEIYKEKPDILGFSCYIWNIEMITSIIENLKKILPNTIFIVGGPEVSYYQSKELIENIDVVVKGEGEQIFLKLLEYYFEGKYGLENIQGISYKQGNEMVANNDVAGYLSLDKIPFVYENGFEDLKDKIIYYESSRGCPFNCQYCMSSLEGNPRFLGIDRCFAELKFFIENNVSQVKFIDRTFNSNKAHALKIWNYLIENDNGNINFHFEIVGDLIDEEILNILKNARPKLFQFEIGVQSTNLKTLKEIDRKTNLEKLFNNINKINSFKNIHLHLDLIIGLPLEDYFSIKKSFMDVYACRPDQLQMGFLKLLHGSGLRASKSKYGFVEKHNPPYEIYYTNDISYDEILKLKDVENIIEIYYNTGNFKYSMIFLEKFFSNSFEMYEAFSDFWVKSGYHQMPHNMRKQYDVLYEFSIENKNISEKNIMKNIIKFDIFLNGYGGIAPLWAVTNYDDKKRKEIYSYLRNYPGNENNKLTRKLFIEEFDYDILSIKNEKYSLDSNIKEEKNFIMFDCSDEMKIKSLDMTGIAKRLDLELFDKI